jgi:hypothetical protein
MKRVSRVFFVVLFLPGVCLAAAADGPPDELKRRLEDRVLAEDGTTANTGPANGGNLDANGVVRAVTPTATSTYAGTWTDDADFAAHLDTAAPWRITNQQDHTVGAAAAERSEGVGLGTCNLPQQLGGTCP